MNCVEAKQLTNIRAAGADEKVFLTPPRQFSLEEMIPCMMPDEMVEVPPPRRALAHGRARLAGRRTAPSRGSPTHEGTGPEAGGPTS